jgi:class 3 adenylate cyclase
VSERHDTSHRDADDADDGDVDDFVAAGLYDPDAPDATAQLELLDYLVEEVGASIPEILHARDHGGIFSLGAFRTLSTGRDRFTLSEAAAQADIDGQFALQLWRCAGFPEPRAYERRFGPPDVEMFRLFELLASFVERDLVLQLARTMGESVSRIADAEVALLRSNVEAPLVGSSRYVDVARTYLEVAAELFPRVADALDTLHRHHLLAIGRRYSDVDARPSALNVVQLAVGFADLAGFTGLSHQLDVSDLAAMISQFEATTGDVVTGAGASVVKRIGDAVMFVTNAPGVGCALSLELIEACARAGLPKLRVGLAFGDVMVRQGDFYGPTVNLAARLVASAEPGIALTDRTLYDRLMRVRLGYTFVPIGRLALAGFAETVEAYQLLRP